MLRRAQTLLNKVGLLAAILFALVAVLPATAAVACADETPPAAASGAVAPCQDPACEHCAIVCGHGCCHAPHAASPHTAAPALSLPTATHDALDWASSPGAPIQAADGLERPPRV
jgi:hypothetical protein